MKKSVILVGFIVAVSTFADVTDKGIASDRPNIVLIPADDMGYGDCGVNNPGSKIAAPNIDQLAKEMFPVRIVKESFS